MRRVILFVACLLLTGGGFCTTFTMSNTNDAGPGSFRDALNLANAIMGRDTITFSIPGIGPFVLQPLTPYPTLTDQSGITHAGIST